MATGECFSKTYEPRRIPLAFGLRHVIQRQAGAILDEMSLKNGITHMTFTLNASSLAFPSHLSHTARDVEGVILLVHNHHAMKAYGGSSGINL